MPHALYFLLLLACPLAMVFMMLGMHGGHGRAKAEEGAQHGGGHADCHSGASNDHGPADLSLADLRSRRAALDREIADLELAERSTAHVRH